MILSAVFNEFWNKHRKMKIDPVYPDLSTVEQCLHDYCEHLQSLIDTVVKRDNARVEKIKELEARIEKLEGQRND